MSSINEHNSEKKTDKELLPKDRTQRVNVRPDATGQKSEVDLREKLSTRGDANRTLKEYLELPSNTLAAGSFEGTIFSQLENKNNLGSQWIERAILHDTTLGERLRLNDEINELRKKIKKLADDAAAAKADVADKNAKIKDYEELQSQLIAKEKINHILARIAPDARERLLNTAAFLDLFKNSRKCDAVVVSIDIRRSTELMLKARKPELYSQFITTLSFKLSDCIIANYGIFDKFTGDGILAFFPKFYSGDDAIIRSVKAANECHQIFYDYYQASRNCFNVFIKDVGLGIGIDYGNVTLVNTQSELTVVGVPVVYACRFSGAKAGETLLNQPAKEQIEALCPQLSSFKESEINIKNEGLALGYTVVLNQAAFNIEKPHWDVLEKKYLV